MNGRITYAPNPTPARTNGLKTFFTANWFKILLLGIFAFVMHRNDASIKFSMGAKAHMPASQLTSGAILTSYAPSQRQATSISTITPIATIPIQTTSKPEAATKIIDENAPLFLETEKIYGVAAKSTAKFSKKQKDSRAYIKRFKGIAVSEMKKYGIPASITLAQGILESNAGISRLAGENNNHFGLKCFSKSCIKGHCSNYYDDDHKDFFRSFDTAWESYRAHSLLLTGKRYRHLSKLEKTNYKAWAKGLQQAGYATSDTYAKNLIQIIEALDLHKYDS